VVDAVMLRALPFDQADRLVAIGRMTSTSPEILQMLPVAAIPVLPAFASVRRS
jgi:hypothetical protein